MIDIKNPQNKARAGGRRSGFTLIETLISLGIFVILVSIAVGGFVTALHTQSQVGSLIAAQSNVSLAVEQMAREIRTGYLFCHNSDAATTTAACGACVTSVDAATGLPVWTCPALDYFTAQGEEVSYSLANGMLMRSASGESHGTPQSLTANNVTVKYLAFRLFGNLEGDTWLPRVTLLMDVSPSSTDPGIASTTLNYETTVSARNRDCSPSSVGSCP